MLTGFSGTLSPKRCRTCSKPLLHVFGSRGGAICGMGGAEGEGQGQGFPPHKGPMPALQSSRAHLDGGNAAQGMLVHSCMGHYTQDMDPRAAAGGAGPWGRMLS